MRRINDRINSGVKRRVVITGIGAVTPCGKGWDELWQAVVNGRSALRPFEISSDLDYPMRAAAAVRGFDPRDYLDAKTARRLDRSAQLALAAAMLAKTDSHLDWSGLNKDRMGVIDGTSLGPMAAILETHRCYLEGNICKATPGLLISGMTGNSSAAITRMFGLRGVASTVSHGSVSSSCAIGWAFRKVQWGELDLVLAGGTEAPLSQDVLLPFVHAGVISTFRGNPVDACRPFAADRQGFVPGEGAVYLIIESLEHALTRNANIICEVAGFSENTDAFHPTSPDPVGEMLKASILGSLAEAGIDKEEIGYINLHGTATKLNDMVESKVLGEIFGPVAKQPYSGSTKQITGHLLGACGSLEAAVTAITLQKQTIPPFRCNYSLDTECPIRVATNGQDKSNLKAAMSLNASFGGRNSCLVLKRFSE
jgi:3-oxoacyl-[acyl-carrier-protein] synthase II